jgi:phosphoribosylformimino-5-aminoimidazole carboxamide ribotide isomerase
VFEILPAIDLRGGRVVRLEQGDFDRETAFADDPVAVASSFADAGARWLHVVDLDGARSGKPVHGEVIRGIVGAVGDRLSVEVAGGLRTEAAVETVLGMGAARAVVGTAALSDPPFAGRLVTANGPERIAVALDVHDDRAMGHGWQSADDSVPLAVALTSLAAMGVTTFEVTAIARDGLLGGPDLELYARLVALDRGSIIASAGVASLADLTALRAIGCAGAIIGRALYDGRLSLRSVLDP